MVLQAFCSGRGFFVVMLMNVPHLKSGRCRAEGFLNGWSTSTIEVREEKIC